MRLFNWDVLVVQHRISAGNTTVSFTISSPQITKNNIVCVNNNDGIINMNQFLPRWPCSGSTGSSLFLLSLLVWNCMCAPPLASTELIGSVSGIEASKTYTNQLVGLAHYPEVDKDYWIKIF